MKETSFVTLTPGVNGELQVVKIRVVVIRPGRSTGLLVRRPEVKVIKLFSAVSYEFS
jgi:hypothetical protein